MEHDEELLEKQIKSELIFDGKVMKVKWDDVELPNGDCAKREYLEHRGGAAILAVDEEGYTYLVRQFRYPYKEVIYEIPAGKLEIGENPDDTAVRELKEEAGLVCTDLVKLGLLYPSPGYTNENLHIYLAKSFTKSEKHLDFDEFLNLYRIPFKEVLRMVMTGEIKDAKTCYAVIRYAYDNKIELQ